MGKTELEERIKEEKSKIQVDSYQDVALDGAWKGGNRTYWGAGIVGLGSGLFVGAMAPLFPVIAGVGLATAISAIPASMMIFGAVGMGVGSAAGLMGGRASGAAAAVAKEQEKRLKAWTVETILKGNPDASIEHEPPQPEKARPISGFWERMNSPESRYFNPKVGVVFAALGAIAGLVMGAAFVLSGGAAGGIVPGAALSALTGMTAETIAANSAAVVAYTAGVMASFGTLFCFNYPKMVLDVTNMIGGYLSGETQKSPWDQKNERAPQAEKAPAQDVAIEMHRVDLEQSGQPIRSTTLTMRQYQSFQARVEEQATKALSNPIDLT